MVQVCKTEIVMVMVELVLSRWILTMSRKAPNIEGNPSRKGEKRRPAERSILKITLTSHAKRKFVESESKLTVE